MGGFFSAVPSHIPVLGKATFRCGLCGCARTWPVNPKHNLKQIAEEIYMRALWASSKTKTSDVSCIGGEARAGKSHCNKHQPQNRIFPAARYLTRGTAAPQVGHTKIQIPAPAKPPQSCAAINRAFNAPSSLSLFLFDQITLCYKSFHCRLLIMHLHWAYYPLNKCESYLLERYPVIVSL